MGERQDPKVKLSTNVIETEQDSIVIGQAILWLVSSENGDQAGSL